MFTITKQVTNYTKFINEDIRYDYENNYIPEGDLIINPQGNLQEQQPNAFPKPTWAIDIHQPNLVTVGSYLYYTESEYNNDVQILKKYV